jgi:hypothetical protein
VVPSSCFQGNTPRGDGGDLQQIVPPLLSITNNTTGVREPGVRSALQHQLPQASPAAAVALQAYAMSDTLT